MLPGRKHTGTIYVYINPSVFVEKFLMIESNNPIELKI
jgi:hypothetical protein